MCNIAKRHDTFFYIEVWDKQTLRDYKISNILGDKTFIPNYLNGSLNRLNKVPSVEYALFWKNKSSAYRRITSLKRHRPKDNYEYIVREIDRDKFISIIPDKIKTSNKFHLTCWKVNKDLKDREVNYKKKLENPWRDYKVKDLNDILK